MTPSTETQLPIPVFSLSDLEKANNRENLLFCLQEPGAFYLKDYGMDDQNHKQIENSALNFFENATQEEKDSITKNVPGMRRGYSKLGTESTAQVTNNGQFTDYAACFSMGVSDNVFPSQKFKGIWTPYFDGLVKVARKVAHSVLNATGSDCGSDIDEFLDCEPLLRYRYYPDVPEERCAEKQPLRMAPHYDLSILTLVHQTPCPNGFVSLQVQINGVYHDVPAIPNTVVVLCGAVGTLVSNGKLKPAMHQIRAPSLEQRIGSHRTSSTLFLRPKATFTFPTQKARDVGFDICFKSETATFRDWMGGNYIGMEAKE